MSRYEVAGVVIRRGSALRQGAAALRNRQQRARHGPWHEAVLQYKLCIVTEGSCDTVHQCARARSNTTGHACDMTGRGGHDTAQCAPRHSAQRAAWAQCVRCLGVVCAQPGFLRCAHCAPNPALTQCTVYSHCLDRCS